jgi:hypothetical protein
VSQEAIALTIPRLPLGAADQTAQQVHNLWMTGPLLLPGISQYRISGFLEANRELLSCRLTVNVTRKCELLYLAGLRRCFFLKFAP